MKTLEIMWIRTMILNEAAMCFQIHPDPLVWQNWGSTVYVMRTRVKVGVKNVWATHPYFKDSKA